jgi:hypothetical protein
MIQNINLTVPVTWSDSALADKLLEDGYILISRPLYDVTREPTTTMVDNRLKVETYVRSVYDTLSTFIDRVNVESETSPSDLLNGFMAAVAGITTP